MKRSFFASIIGGVFALTQVAQAAAPQTEAKFETLDKDHDGKVTLNEASDHDGLFVAFKNLDKDKDGNLTKQEFEGYKASR